MTIQLYQGDCLDILPTLPDQSVDAIICDPPYGQTSCKWDSVIPFEPMWKQLKRIIKPRGAIVLFGSQPFTSALVMSNAEWLKYEWIWYKSKAGGFTNARNKPLSRHENILVFSQGTVANKSLRRMNYYPQGLQVYGRIVRGNRHARAARDDHRYARPSHKDNAVQEFRNYPSSVIAVPNERTLHPTQKPVALLEYLVRTYTNEGETVLDFAFGSGTTGVACVNTGRSFIGIEKEQQYFDIAQQRINAAAATPIQLTYEEAH